MKIILKDGHFIVGRATRKIVEEMNILVASGPDEKGDLFVSLGRKNKPKVKKIRQK